MPIENKIESPPQDKSKLPHESASFIKAFYQHLPVEMEKLLLEAIQKGGISRNEENITPLDFFSLNPNIRNDELKALISSRMGISNPEKTVETISEIFQKSKQYLTEYLHVNLPKEIENLNEFKNWQSVLEFLRKTGTLGRKEKMTFSPYYCATASVMLAEWEYEKEGFQHLMKESTYVFNQLFEKDKNNISRFHRVQIFADNLDRVGILDYQGDWIKAKMNFRGKNRQSLINKMIIKPETTADEIIKDGIGVKIELEDVPHVLKVAQFLPQYLKENFGAQTILFENKGILNPAAKETAKLKETLETRGASLVEDNNEYSGKRFKNASIVCKINIPAKGEKGGMKVQRNLEIQLLPVDSKRSKGMTKHPIYKGIQKLAAYSRLFGSFGDKYLDLICQEAHKETNISPDKIKNYILETFIVPLETTKKGRKKYGWKSHLERLSKAGLLPPQINKIMKARQ
ncbi:MAG: hypothetical protein ABIC19_02840 [Patescibacteria group bacterium]|nr:hypothetical protein [Patescibacteria group bacterium]